jgi:hypothetical protein
MSAYVMIPPICGAELFRFSAPAIDHQNHIATPFPMRIAASCKITTKQDQSEPLAL